MPNANEAKLEVPAAPYAPYRAGTVASVRTAEYRTKRALDLALVLLAAPLCVPVCLIVAAAIKAEAPSGPIFYAQTRLGKDGKPFRIYKFRSMIPGAERMLDKLRHLNELQGAMFKIKNDPRVTRVGRFIRRTSLDELPQLFNVLRGDMSLVGPRPPLPSEVEEYTSYELLRLRAKPGCTGLWQVNGRNRLHFAEMVEMDIDYIERCSFRLDLKLIFKTLIVMFRAKDAY